MGFSKFETGESMTAAQVQELIAAAAAGTGAELKIEYGVISATSSGGTIQHSGFAEQPICLFTTNSASVHAAVTARNSTMISYSCGGTATIYYVLIGKKKAG